MWSAKEGNQELLDIWLPDKAPVLPVTTVAQNQASVTFNQRTHVDNMAYYTEA